MTESDRPDNHGSMTDANGTIRTTFDWSVTDPSTAVIETVAVATDSEPTAIEPLYESVDPDALDQLIRSSENQPTRRETAITFGLAGLDVTVLSDGAVVVRPAEA